MCTVVRVSTTFALNGWFMHTQSKQMELVIPDLISQAKTATKRGLRNTNFNLNAMYIIIIINYNYNL